MQKYDFHSHSDISDGRYTPEQVVERAYHSGVKYFALTDHDDFSGDARARKIAATFGINLISGVEVSTTWQDKTIHVLGFGFNPLDETFTRRLAEMRATRIERAERINQALGDLGFPDMLAGAQAVAGRREPISRTHFAYHMIRMGYCRNFAECMNKYLGEGRPAAVPHQWAAIPTAVSWIHQAGGRAFLAHPLRYKLPQALTLEDLVGYFREVGGDGLEVVYANQSPRQNQRLAQLALQHHLAASGGSDFHSDDEKMGGVAIGNIPPLPTYLPSLPKILGLI